MPRDGCDFCCQPGQLALSKQSRDVQVAQVLCAIWEALGGVAGASGLPDSVSYNSIPLTQNVVAGLAANPDRKAGSQIVNPVGSGATVYITEDGTDPSTTNGIPVPAGTIYSILSTANVKMFQSAVALMTVTAAEVI